jgi:hypothetical protein
MGGAAMFSIRENKLYPDKHLSVSLSCYGNKTRENRKLKRLKKMHRVVMCANVRVAVLYVRVVCQHGHKMYRSLCLSPVCVLEMERGPVGATCVPETGEKY